MNLSTAAFLALSANTLHHADCFDVLPHIPDQSVDLVLMDPPYGTTACKWDTPLELSRLWPELERVTKPNAAIVMFGAQPFTSALVMSNPKHFRYELIWEKSNRTGFLNAKKMPLRAHENILVFYRKLPIYNPQMTKGKPYVSGKARRVQTSIYGKYNLTTTVSDGSRYPISLLKYTNATATNVHPTQKPVPLLEYLIRTYTNEGALVLDCTMGVGSTCVAAALCGRSYLGIEREAGYHHIAQERLRG